MDTYGSRSLAVGGIALYQAAQKIVAKARTLAAHLLEVGEDELDYEAGTFSAGDKAMTIKELAFAAWAAHNLPPGMEPGLEATAVYDPPNFSWPGGAHVAVVEIDTETGDVTLDPLRRRRRRRQGHQPDDRGRADPRRDRAGGRAGPLRGGGLRRGRDAAHVVAGRATSFPSAAELPSFELDRTETPSPTNPLGVKGVGETGAIASPAAVMNAVVDALAPFGVTDIDMPATPERVWRALEEARQ